MGLGNMATHDLKTLTLVTSGIVDTSILFGSDTGQASAVPDPITALAVKNYVLSGVSAFSLTLFDDANAAAAQTTLGLSPLAASGTVADLGGLGAGVATFLATPSSANLAAAVTGGTGTGALVFATSPTLVTPVLGVASGSSIHLNGADALIGAAASRFQISATVPGEWISSVILYSNDANPPRTIMAKSRGATIGSHADIQNFDDLGSIQFYGSFNGDWREAARLKGIVYNETGTLSGSTIPGAFDFICTNSAGAQIHCAVMAPVTDVELVPSFGVGCRNFFPERVAHFTHRTAAGIVADTVIPVLRLTRGSNHTVFGNSVGLAIESEVETTNENHEIGGLIENICIDNTLGSEDFAWVLKTMVGGAPATEGARLVGGALSLGVVSTLTGQLSLANSASANLTIIQAGNAAAAVTYTWPTNVGAAGTVLTDAAGNGTLSWAAGGGTITGSDTHVLFFDGANTPAGDAGLTYNKTTDVLTVVGRLNLGGNTSSSGALRATGAAVEVVKADNSAYTTIQAFSFTTASGSILNDTSLYLSNNTTAQVQFGSNGDITLLRNGVGILSITDGSTGGAVLEFIEQTAPVGSANRARLFAQDTGGGKTRLVVIFGSGVQQVLATEP